MIDGLCSDNLLAGAVHDRGLCSCKHFVLSSMGGYLLKWLPLIKRCHLIILGKRAGVSLGMYNVANQSLDAFHFSTYSSPRFAEKKTSGDIHQWSYVHEESVSSHAYATYVLPRFVNVCVRSPFVQLQFQYMCWFALEGPAVYLLLCRVRQIRRRHRSRSNSSYQRQQLRWHGRNWKCLSRQRAECTVCQMRK